MYFFKGKSFVHIPIPDSEEIIEKTIIENQQIVFSEFVVVDIKMQGIVEGNHRTLNDLILVSKTCDQWFIVEVERKNDPRYVSNHIHEQLALQSQASWRRIIPQVREDLIRNHGFDAETVLNLGDEDPGFYLFIPESTDLIKQICSRFSVKILETKIWMNQLREYALEITNPENLPKAWNQDLIELDDLKWRRVFQNVQFQFPKTINKSIKDFENCMMYIDDTVHNISLSLNDWVEIPLSNHKNSDTYGLVILQRWQANFRINKDPRGDILYLHFERRNWY